MTREAEWQDLFLFDYLKQSYLIAARHVQETVASIGGLPEEARKKTAFYTRQYVDALSPSRGRPHANQSALPPS